MKRTDAKVLLPFIEENQLKGFVNKECAGLSEQDINHAWRERQNMIQPLSKKQECRLHAMSDEEQQALFDEEDIQAFYENDIAFMWLENWGSAVPLKPFIADEPCRKYRKSIKSKDDVLKLCLGTIQRKEGAFKIERTGDESLLRISILSDMRNMSLRGYEIIPSKKRREVNVSMTVGLSSPFIEAIAFDRNVFIINGIQRLCAIHEAGYEDMRIPCIIYSEQVFEKIRYSQAYGDDLIEVAPLPAVADFFNEELTFSFKMKSSLKHVQIIVSDVVVPGNY
ncbi:hypothetical protein [Paenibacillus koleovorans]|uniref:hypothetical protein n=1 Tax=Paenibacillus koleovorans TaxID=121608 RepID=UPI000FDAD516|nr:hypothetical protein [Paenibacillus koleovorans]